MKLLVLSVVLSISFGAIAPGAFPLEERLICES